MRPTNTLQMHWCQIMRGRHFLTPAVQFDRATARFLAVALVAVIACAIPAAARAEFTPKSPKVHDLVARGVKNLEEANDPRVGADALLGLTLLKADIKPDNSVVQRALAAVRKTQADKALLTSQDVYTIGLCLIFLVKLDPVANKAEIQAYLDHLLSIQKPSGGWGYPNRPTGDTSMTQYGVLAMWEAEHAGLKAPLEAWEKVANWLMRTQDPSGAWGYQGNDPGNFKLIPQNEIRHSMVSAGLGSLYICADRFQYRRALYDPNAGLPTALQRVRKAPAPQAAKVVATRVDLARLGQALDAGDAWMRENYKIDPSQYQHYYLYAFERYQSFRELSATSPFQPSHWYDDGVYFLERTINDKGGWSGQTGEPTDTAFSMLFLLRSSKKSIEKAHHLGPGTLITGRGLPEGNDIELRMGQVRPKPLSGPAEQLLAAIEDPGHPDYLRAVEGLEEKVEKAPPAELGKLATRLRTLAGGDSPAARAAALHTLGRTRDIDQVPLLLAALEDPDDDVFITAEEALQFISRTISDPSENEGITPARRANAVRKWRNWFLSIRPNAKLDE
ncbi:MAG: prenyltransferase/squalene oxidase repeat-containing protein [Singulisphaera sp.]